MDATDAKLLVLFAVSAYRNLLFVFIILSLLQSLAGLRLPDWLRPAGNFIYDCCEPFLRVWRSSDGDRTVEPHTVMVVKRTNLPDTVDEVFACSICELWKQHLNDPNDESSGIARIKVKVGKPGFQTQGDSLLMLDKTRPAAQVNAPVGRIIHYMCAFHPWMQGIIRVTKSGKAPS